MTFESDRELFSKLVFSKSIRFNHTDLPQDLVHKLFKTQFPDYYIDNSHYIMLIDDPDGYMSFEIYNKIEAK